VRWFDCETSATVDVLPALCLAVLGESDESATRVAAALAEVAPEVRPLVLTGSPAETREAHGYDAVRDARSYVLGNGTAGVRGLTGALGRSGALLLDAGLHRLGRRPRLAASSGAQFLGGLLDADALLVAGDTTLRGARGEREALQQLSTVLAAAALGLSVVVLSTTGKGVGAHRLTGRLIDSVPVGEGELTAAVGEAVRRLRERTG